MLWKLRLHQQCRVYCNILTINTTYMGVTHHTNHMIPRCVHIHSSHLSCKQTEQQGEYLNNKRKIIHSASRKLQLSDKWNVTYFQDYCRASVFFFYHDAITYNLCSASKEKHTGSAVLFCFSYTLLDIKVKKNKQEAVFTSITQKFSHICGSTRQFPPPYFCTKFQFHIAAYGDL